eukprot:3907831-Prymnesium_polylepis.1
MRRMRGIVVEASQNTVRVRWRPPLGKNLGPSVATLRQSAGDAEGEEEDADSDHFEVEVLPWSCLREWLRTRTIAMYWLGVAAEAACSPGGRARLADRAEFERDFDDGAAAAVGAAAEALPIGREHVPVLGAPARLRAAAHAHPQGTLRREAALVSERVHLHQQAVAAQRSFQLAEEPVPAALAARSHLHAAALAATARTAKQTAADVRHITTGKLQERGIKRMHERLGLKFVDLSQVVAIANSWTATYDLKTSDTQFPPPSTGALAHT